MRKKQLLSLALIAALTTTMFADVEVQETRIQPRKRQRKKERQFFH